MNLRCFSNEFILQNSANRSNKFNGVFFLLHLSSLVGFHYLSEGSILTFSINSEKKKFKHEMTFRPYSHLRINCCEQKLVISFCALASSTNSCFYFSFLFIGFFFRFSKNLHRFLLLPHTPHMYTYDIRCVHLFTFHTVAKIITEWLLKP